ncbi:XRE family transcriptional regulator [Lactiplantibacillus pentosus]|uniref:helix-turn-helix domain-containing protein n=1 Tax=Lactiplantibacillus pentosus TaxID=1589 RepID=UPI0021A4C3FC|nr:helix-turn-helix transcriptional regulator [Lactiplantibacillus pentosus]MCT3282882.1 XRE family transcriptional regulator [Lactiplantibacillus pentosus]
MLPEIGKIIRQRRQQQGITIEQLAEQSNVSISLISRLERGKVNNIKIQSLSAIAETLDLKLADFFRDPLLQSTNVVALLDYLSDLPVNQREELAGVLLKLLHLAK